MSAVVGPGILARMQECGDEPLSSEWTEVINMGGYEVRLAKAWGRKGLYISSPDSGGWVTSGPFGGGD